MTLLLLAGVLAACGKPDAAQLLAAGQELQAKGDIRSAQIQIRAALQADPSLHAARLAFGKLLMASGDAELAVVELERVVREAPTLPGAHEEYARALVVSANEKRAIQALTTLKPPNASELASVRAQLALVWSSLGEARKADDALKAALAADPKNPLALNYAARSAWQQGDAAAANRYIAAALEASPGHADALNLRGLFKQAQGDLQGATVDWEASVAAAPAQVPAHESLIAASLAQGDAATARKRLDALKKHMAWHPSARLAEARILIAENNLPKAREIVLGLLSAAPDHPSLLSLAGAIESRIGSPVQAAAHFRKLLAASPDRDGARIELARVEMRLGQYADALRTIAPITARDDAPPNVLALASEAELNQGNFKRADELLRRASEAAPDDTRLQSARLVRRMRLGEVEQPLAQLEALARDSKDSYADDALFAARMALGDFDAALAVLDRIAQKNPGKAQNAELRARVYLVKRDFAKGRQALNEALKLDPKSFGAVAALAMIDQLEGQPEQAIARVQAAVDADPANAVALMLLADLRARHGGTIEQTTALLKRAVAASPLSAGPRLKLIELSLNRRLYKEALEHARAALAELPNDERLLDAAGRAQLASGDVEQAATTFRSLSSLLPKSAAPLLELARVYQIQGRNEAVLTTLRRAVELEPTSEAVQKVYVDILMSSRMAPQALAHVRKLREARPKEPVGYALLATVLERNRDVPGAAASLRDGLAQTSQPELARRLYALLLRHGKTADASAFAAQWMKRVPDDLPFEALIAEYEITQGQLKPAEERLRRVVQQYPANVTALNNLAWVVANSAGSDAVGFARRALSVAPDRPDLLDTLALALSIEGKHPEAMAAQRRAVELAPENPLIRLGMARVALAAGQKDQARKELAELKKLNPGFAASKPVADLEARL